MEEREMKVISTVTYEQPVMGISVMGDKVEIIGEQVVEFEMQDLDQYIYNIQGYTPENGKPFSMLKANITLI